MNLRQTRRHFYGNSNADEKIKYKAEHPEEIDARGEGLTATQFLALPKKKTFQQLVNLREKQVPPPELLEKTQSLYNETHKTITNKAKISRPRFHQLEEHELRKMVYTGDSYYAYDINPEIRAKKESIERMKKKETSQAAIKQKQMRNAQAEMETQQVDTSLLAAQPTEGQAVDLKKVRDIRWILKRRYLKSRNFQRIFTYWDMDHKGKVSAQNIYDMCKHLGLNANPKECEAVLASADRKGNGYLGPDDFLDLIYNDLDLLALPDLKLPGASTIVPSQDVPAMLQSLSAIAKQQRDNRHFNQVKYVLKNRLTNLIKDFKRNDTDENNLLTLYNFERVLKNLNISDKVMDHDDIERLFKQYAKDYNKINYLNFCEEIGRTYLDDDNAYSENAMPKDLKRPQSTPEDNVRNRLFVKKLRDLDQINDEIHFIDNKLLPAHNLGLVEKKMIKMKRFFSNYFPEKNQFIEFLGQNLGVSSEALPTTNISQQQFKKIITGLLEKVDQKVENRLLQGFFANFTYNKFGQVNVQSIADQLFNETDKEFYMRVMKRPKGPPPCYNGNEVAMIAVSDEEQALRK